MNILGICLSPGKGGLELYAHNIISMLQDKGHHCHFALAEGKFLQTLDWEIPLIITKPGFRKFPLQAARRIAAYIDEHAIDIIHIHWNKDLNLAALSKKLSRRKPRLVYSRHMEITRPKKSVYHRILYRQVDMMLVISDFVRQQALKFLPLRAEQIELLYLGVPKNEQTSKSACTNNYPAIFNNENKFVIGMIGRIEAYKGQHILINAVASLLQNGKECVVAMAGAVMDEKYFEQLQAYIKSQGIEKNVHYLGSIKNPTQLMACCDVVVLTTYCETFGLVLAEAMRSGTAVIGTDAGGVPEIIHNNDTGMLFTPGDSMQLMECLKELMEDAPKRERLRLAGQKFADLRFDDITHVRNLEGLLNRILTAS